MRWIDDQVHIGPPAAAFIAAGMRRVALADGNFDERELDLIRAFEARLPAAARRPGPEVIDSPPLQDAYMRSLIMVALADGKVTDTERDLIVDLAAPAGVDAQDVALRILDVRRYFIDVMVDVELFHEAVLQVARDLGWDDAQLDELMATLSPG